MKRRLILISSIGFLLASCGTFKTASDTTLIVDESTTTSAEVTVATTQAPTSPSALKSVKYSMSQVGTLKDAVDLTERSSTDAFFYVVSRAGTIQKWSTTNEPPQTVLDISSLTTSEGERGLLGLAFRQINNQWFAYINHTDRDGNTQVVEYVVNTDGSFDSASRRVVLSIEQPYSNHNGGGLAIGPDNMLYIGMGDGGASGDPERRARNLTSLLGKILRIDPTATAANPYSIPTDNPYIGTANARGEIWSIGLRNPWRFSFDASGNLWIADVGQNKWEEVNMTRRTKDVLAGRGVDYGWSAYEGTHRFNKDEPKGSATDPIYEYEHSDGNCSISGSAVATQKNMPLRKDWYFFGDYCSGRITALHLGANNEVHTETVTKKAGNITGLRSISKGVYVLTLDGKISRVSAEAA